MEILAAILFAIGIILASSLMPGSIKDYKDEKWMEGMSKRLMPNIRDEVERENIGNSFRTEE